MLNKNRLAKDISGSGLPAIDITRKGFTVFTEYQSHSEIGYLSHRTGPGKRLRLKDHYDLHFQYL
jgi:hypothetical protein